MLLGIWDLENDSTYASKSQIPRMPRRYPENELYIVRTRVYARAAFNGVRLYHQTMLDNRATYDKGAIYELTARFTISCRFGTDRWY